jgi:primosomal protein N' (replication factor Y)
VDSSPLRRFPTSDGFESAWSFGPLMRIGAGTQKLESELERQVPGLERIRLDADTTSKPAELAAALERFRHTEGAVLLGTQMVAKGHHFAGVELAAVVDADLGLGLPDFRAEERTFQLVTQLAGRSGRDAPGRVIVQTFQPDASALVFAARHDVAGFLAAELQRREALGYPPFHHVLRVLVSGRSADGPLRALTELKSRLASEDVVGPAPLSRLRGRHRAQLIAKTDAPRNVAGQAGRWLAAAATSMRKLPSRWRSRRNTPAISTARKPRSTAHNVYDPRVIVRGRDTQ